MTAKPRPPGPAGAAPMVVGDHGRPALGPLGARIAIGSDEPATLVDRVTGAAFGTGTNPLIVLHRTAFLTKSDQPSVALDPQGHAAVLRWAEQAGLGQDETLIQAVNARRDAAVSHLVRRRGGAAARRIMVRPFWRLAVGLGNRTNAYEVGIALHGTYGWPIVPGSTIKGAVAAWALHSGAAEAQPEAYGRIFGLPRIGDDRPLAGSGGASEAGRGSVTFLDAIPAPEAVRLRKDVVTPHVQPYYTASGQNGTRQPPAEYHQPVPSQFLTISGGTLRIDLIGPVGDVDTAAGWCRNAVSDLGIGAKAAAGYGYLHADPTVEIT